MTQDNIISLVSRRSGQILKENASRLFLKEEGVQKVVNMEEIVDRATLQGVEPLIAHFLPYRTQDPSNPHTALILAVLYEMGGRDEIASGYYQQAADLAEGTLKEIYLYHFLDFNKKKLAPRKNFGFLRLAEVLEEKYKQEQSHQSPDFLKELEGKIQAAYAKAIQNDPASIAQLADFYNGVGRREEARKIWSDLAQKEEDGVQKREYLVQIADSYVAEGKYQEALPQLIDFLQDAYRRLGESKNSREDFKGARIDLRFASEMILEVYEKLESISEKEALVKELGKKELSDYLDLEF